MKGQLGPLDYTVGDCTVGCVLQVSDRIMTSSSIPGRGVISSEGALLCFYLISSPQINIRCHFLFYHFKYPSHSPEAFIVLDQGPFVNAAESFPNNVLLPGVVMNPRYVKWRYSELVNIQL